MEDILMSKKYYWIINKKFYEVSKETYQKFKKEYDHSKMLREYEEEDEIEVLSLDGYVTEDITVHEMLGDPEVNVEEEAVHNVMLEKLKAVMKELSEKEKDLIEQLYKLEFTESEIGAKFGISQCAVHKRKVKLLTKVKKLLEK